MMSCALRTELHPVQHLARQRASAGRDCDPGGGEQEDRAEHGDERPAMTSHPGAGRDRLLHLGDDAAGPGRDSLVEPGRGNLVQPGRDSPPSCVGCDVGRSCRLGLVDQMIGRHAVMDVGLGFPVDPPQVPGGRLHVDLGRVRSMEPPTHPRVQAVLEL
jgi:hypothetical protein